MNKTIQQRAKDAMKSLYFIPWSKDRIEAEFVKQLTAQQAEDAQAHKAAYERISWLEGQREIECQQKENALAESEACLKEAEQLRVELSHLRAENAAKDAALRAIDEQLSNIFWSSDDGITQRKGEPEDADCEKTGIAWKQVRASLSTTPLDQVSTKGGDELCPTKCNSVSTDSAVQTLSRVSNAAQTSDPSAAAPPSCVPVEVLAKLVESVEDYFKSILAGDYSRLQQLGHKIDEALALAVPFLTKGDK